VIGGDRAFYRPSTDTVHMPDEGLFTGTDTMSRSESWHAVELHEIGHWSSHATRCNRDLGKRFGDKAYCAEELVAEIISATLCAVSVVECFETFCSVSERRLGVI
jgi:antirestriction protein ArdC